MDGQALAAIKIYGVVVNNPIVPISLTENDLPVQTMPGFGPAAEVLLFRQNDPKPLTPRPASLDKADANYVWAGQLATLRQGPSVYESIHPGGPDGRRPKGARYLEKNTLGSI